MGMTLILVTMQEMYTDVITSVVKLIVYSTIRLYKLICRFCIYFFFLFYV